MRNIERVSKSAFSRNNEIVRVGVRIRICLPLNPIAYVLH